MTRAKVYHIPAELSPLKRTRNIDRLAPRIFGAIVIAVSVIYPLFTRILHVKQMDSPIVPYDHCRIGKTFSIVHANSKNSFKVCTTIGGTANHDIVVTLVLINIRAHFPRNKNCIILCNNHAGNTVAVYQLILIFPGSILIRIIRINHYILDNNTLIHSCRRYGQENERM